MLKFESASAPFPPRYAEEATLAKSVGCISAQPDGTFVIDDRHHFNRLGELIPPEERHSIIVPSKLIHARVPMIVAGDGDAVTQLYTAMQQELPSSTFMAAVLLGGMRRTIHYLHRNKHL